MFKFLKKTLKNTISKFTKKIDKEAETEEQASNKLDELKESISGLKQEIQELKKTISEQPKTKEVSEILDDLKTEEKVEYSAASLIEEEKEPEPELSEEERQLLEEVGTKQEQLEEKQEELKEIKQEIKEETKPKLKKKTKEIEIEQVEEPTSFLGKLKHKFITKKISDTQFEEMFWDLEVALLENNVAVDVITKIKTDLKATLVDKPILRTKISDTISHSLKQSIGSLFDVEQIDILEKSKEKQPYVICFVGINGSGKTTTIAKVANLLKKNKRSCVIAAADTFRAASIEQLQEHADKLGVKVIKHDYGSDPAAVAFDAVKYAKQKNIDVVLIDTAGRLHSNVNLVDEMKKIIRVSNPDLKIFIGESITGNDCVEQSQKFNEAIGIDGIILSKADVDEKGGAAISVSYVTGKPILYLGTGQKYNDLQPFDSSKILSSLGF